MTMPHQIEPTHKEIEIIKRSQMEILELTSAITEVKRTLLKDSTVYLNQ